MTPHDSALFFLTFQPRQPKHTPAHTRARLMSTKKKKQRPWSSPGEDRRCRPSSTSPWRPARRSRPRRGRCRPGPFSAGGEEQEQEQEEGEEQEQEEGEEPEKEETAEEKGTTTSSRGSRRSKGRSKTWGCCLRPCPSWRRQRRGRRRRRALLCLRRLLSNSESVFFFFLANHLPM